MKLRSATRAELEREKRSAQDSIKLPGLMQSLPQELYDTIFDMVFQAHSGKRDFRQRSTELNFFYARLPCKYALISGGWRSCPDFKYDHYLHPPVIGLSRETLKLLSIDRATRAYFANSYFTTDFISDRCEGIGLDRFMDKLDSKHRALIKCIHIAVYSDVKKYPAAKPCGTVDCQMVQYENPAPRSRFFTGL